MSYIKKELREEIETQRTGVLNYTITKPLPEIYTLDEVRYSDLNEIVGMSEDCKSEFYRRNIVPYENSKLPENGSVLDNVASLTTEYLDLNIKLTVAEIDLQNSFR